MSTHEQDESAYQALAESLDGDDGRWAFGTGFTESGEEITAPVPDGVDAGDLAAYCLMLGDDALVAAQRLAEWSTHAPELEEEVALANCALDLLGQARLLLSRAGHLGAAAAHRPGNASPDLADEDVLTYFRDERTFRHVNLAEADVSPGGADFGRLMAWLLLFSSWRLALLTRLVGSADPLVAAVAEKGAKELAYHRDHAARWMVRLGDGTAYSHERAQDGLEQVWPFVEELYVAHEVETRLPGVAVDPASVREEVDGVLAQVVAAGGLTRPERPAVGRIAGRAGRDGLHTEALGPLVAQMQSLARAHPEATW
jgi:ring-1,2-phenylacetyl-CoA epoxidase subunit PaaC